MKQIKNNPQEYPILSQWNEEKLNQTIETLTKQANPSIETPTESQKLWTATMLEMDLAHQSQSIWEEEDNSQMIATEIHNHRVIELKKLYNEGNIAELDKIWTSKTEEDSPAIKRMAWEMSMDLEDLPY